MYLFDNLVKWQYEHNREQWEKDGKPYGFMTWPPKGFPSKGWSLGLTEKRLDGSWLCKTPKWVSESKDCLRWLFYKRICICVAVLDFVFMIKFIH